MRLGILIATPGRNADKLITEIESLVKSYESKLVFFIKTYEEIRLIERKKEEIR